MYGVLILLHPMCMKPIVASTCMPGRWTVCILNRDGEIMLHRNMPTTPETFLKAMAPYRQDLVVAVECMYTWYWLADLCVQEGITFVLGHAQYMKAIHGGKAKNDRLDAQKCAGFCRLVLDPLGVLGPNAASHAARPPPPGGPSPAGWSRSSCTRSSRPSAPAGPARRNAPARRGTCRR